jgi:DinB family protein
VSAPLTPAEIAPLLDAAMTTLRAELGSLPERVLTAHPAPGEWCAKEVVGHLIEAERRGFAGRIRTILVEVNPTLEGWDPDAVARARKDCSRPIAELLAELAEIRPHSAALVRGLHDADLARAALHPKVGRISISDILQEWVHHDRNHIKQALAGVQAYVWPAMGNTQRFSRA